MDWIVAAGAAVLAFVGALTGARIAGVWGLKSTERQAQADHLLAAISLAEARRNALSQRVGEYLGSTHHAVLSLRSQAMAKAEQKVAVDRSETWPTVERVNSALAAIRVTDVESVTAAALAVDEEMKRLSNLVNKNVYTRESWRDERDARLVDLVETLIETARSEASRLLAEANTSSRVG